MPRPTAASLRWVSAAGLFGFALLLGVWIARPVHAASIAFDSQVAVLDFSRLLSGHRVEVFLSTTPKPLLTFIFGPLELLSHDWRSLAWATLLAFGLGVVLMAELASRFGGKAAWAFVGIGLAGSGALLNDVAYALAVPWAMLGWAIAGLALSRPRPRYGLAGIALMLATLARIETILIVGLAAVVLVAFTLPPVARAAAGVGISRPPRRAWLILVGFAALPVMGIHDLLIYGDPLFWSTVATRYSAVTSLHILSPAGLLRSMIGHYRGLWPLGILGLIGVVRLIRGRAWAVLIGLAAMGPGMAAFLLYLAVRHIFVPDRYFAPIDIASILAAGVGAGWLLEIGAARLGHRLGGRPGQTRAVAAGSLVLALGLAGVSTWPSGLLDPSLRTAAHRSLALAADLDQMDPVLRQIVDRTPGARTWPVGGGSAGVAPAMVLMYVPLPYRPRMSVDLDAPLTIIGDTAASLASAAGHPVAGQFVAHDWHADGALPLWRPYESPIPVTFNGVSIVPVASDPARGWWITEVRNLP